MPINKQSKMNLLNKLISTYLIFNFVRIRHRFAATDLLGPECCDKLLVVDVAVVVAVKDVCYSIHLQLVGGEFCRYAKNRQKLIFVSLLRYLGCLKF